MNDNEKYIHLENNERRDIEMVSRLAFLGLPDELIAAGSGMTVKEFAELEARQPDMFLAIRQAKARAAVTISENLFRLASESNDINAIKFFLSRMSDSYSDKKDQTINLNASFTAKLPTTAEALEIISADPSLLPASQTE